MGVFVTAAVLLQLFLLDSMRLGVYFAPLAYVAFIVLLPVNTKPLAMLFLGFALGAFMDFFEGTAGLHTATTLLTAYLRRPEMTMILGKDVVGQENVMPSVKSLGGGKFFRFVALAVGVHCLVFFTLESLSWENYHLVLLKTAVSGVVTLFAVWAVSMLFTLRARRRI